MTVLEALTQAAQTITRRDADLLLLHVLRHEHRDRAWLLAHPEAPLDEHKQSAFFDLVARRAAHTPVQYLTGHQEFFGLALRVTPDTLIPRPETEILVQAVLNWIEDWVETDSPTPPVRILDIGTGTGAIAIVLAANIRSAEIFAVDISPATAAVVAENAARHGLADRINFIHSDLLSRFQTEVAAGLRFDVVVSNPPYVASTDAPTLEREVRDFEPHTALFAGPDGLAIYRRLIPQAFQALRSGGLLAMEFGFGQREALSALLNGWRNVRVLDDLAGIPRVVLAERP